MANKKHLERLTSSIKNWNKWRAFKGVLKPDLSGARLRGARLNGANLKGVDLSNANLNSANLNSANLSNANLSNADLNRADLSEADLSGANLRYARLHEADLSWADLSGADLTTADLRRADLSSANLSNAILNEVILSKAYLSAADLSRASLYCARLNGANLVAANFRNARLSRADLSWADLSGTNFSGADLSEADLHAATLIETKFPSANLTGCRVYGVSAWKVDLERAKQRNLIITDHGEPTITVDNLEVAQFFYLLLNNEKIRNVIDNITSKAVLILGRFTPERKVVLDSLREELRVRNYLPILFDFDKPASRNFTETVSTLAHMARFVIADITDAKSIPQELQRIVPHLPSLPVQPLILSSQYEYEMFADFLDYPWVLTPYRYDSLDSLLQALSEKVIAPVVAKVKEIEDKHTGIGKR